MKNNLRFGATRLLLKSFLMGFLSFFLLYTNDVASQVTFTQTTDADFNKGALNNVVVSGNSVNLQYAASNAGLWWTGATFLPQNLTGHKTATANNKYVYLVGGYNGSLYSNNVHVATIQTAGISAWTSLNPLPVGLRDPAVVVGTNIIYVLGGRDATQVFDAIYYANINADGTIGAWQTSDITLPTALWGHSAVFVNGFIYVAGGSNISSETSALNTVYYTKLKADNTLSAFSTGTNLPATRNMQSMVTYNNKIYLIGGYDHTGTKTNTVYFAIPESTGPTGPWLSETPLPVAISNHAAVVSNGLIMVLGGITPSSQSNAVYYANSDQALPLTWVTSTNLMFDFIKDGSAFQGNGQVIYTGGTSQTGNILSNCRYATLTLTSNYVNHGVFVSCPFYELGTERLINSMAFTATYNATYSNCQVSYRLAGSDKIWGDWTALTSTSPITVNQTKQFVQYSVFFTGQTTYNVTFSDMALTTPGTPLNGNLNAITTFTAAASPYVVFSNISFTSGTHTFQAGTTILFSPNTGMSVSQASVVCNGTAADSVKFINLGVETGKWNGIYFDANSNTGVSSQFFYTVIAGAGSGTNNANLYCYQTQQPYLSQCNIRNADGNGIRLVSSDPSFQNTVIKENTENGINLDNSNPTVAICTISYNGGAGIYANTVATIMNGTAIHHNLYGIRYTSPNFSISQPIGSPTVTDNTFNGIALNGGDITTSDKTWNSLPYEYFLLGTVKIMQSSANVRLTIKPGNTIKVANGAQIQVGFPNYSAYGGELYAIGTADSLITFTPINGVAGGWNGIYFTNYSDAYGGHSQMAYCIIEKGNDYNIFSESTIQPDILYHCTVRNAVLDGAKYTNSTMPGAIDNCQFLNNGRYPLYSYITNTDQIHTNNTYTGNGINKIVIYGGNYSTDRTITNDGIPYYVLNTIYIGKSDGNSRLTIEPGVTLEFAGEKQIQVGQYNAGGELYALGTAGNPIIFKAYNDTPGGWGGICFSDYNDNYAGTSTLEYCTVKQGATYNISCENSTQPTLDHCIISNSASHGIIEAFSSAQIHDCQFLNNNGYPLKYNDPNCNSHLLNNIYSGNTMNYIALPGGQYDADRTLYNDGIPYHVLGDIYLYQYQGNLRITIKPGATLAFAPGARLNIGWSSSYGAELYAEGSADSVITFKPFNNSIGGWNGIYFCYADNYGATSSMKYCKIEKGATYNVSCYGTSQLLMDHCVLDKSAGNGLIINNSSIVIAHTAISNSGLFGIDASTFSGTIDNCVISDSDSIGINAYSFTGSILNSTISNSGSFGINAYSFTGSILNSTISNSGSHGIAASYSSGPVHNCQFLNNNGYPLKYADISCDFHLSGNTYIGNTPNYIALSGGEYSENRIFYNDGIPYHVLGDLRITNSVRITIKPGTTLAFGFGKRLQIGVNNWGYDNELFAEGNADSVITFKPYNNLPGGWGGLYFSNGGPGSTSSLKYCRIEKAAANNILCENTSQLLMEHCELAESSGNGLKLSNSTPLVIRNSSFANNVLNGILLEGNSNPVIGDSTGYSCNFYSNGAYHIYNNTYNPVYARYNFWASCDSVEIKTHIYDETDNADKGFVYIRPFVGLPYLVTDSMGLSGVVRYANTASSSMNNATLKIKTIENTEVGSAITNSSGAFAFAPVQSGSYHLTIVPAEPWEGVNSTDALHILFHFSHISLLNGIKLAAADVNSSGFVNATDALLVMKRFVGQIPTFPSGDAFMEIDTLMVNGNQVTNNLKMIWFGDVNGSFVPLADKSLTSVSLSQEGTLYATSFTEFDLPVKIKKSHDIGAISFGFYYPQEFFEIQGVELKNGSTDFTYSAADGLFRMAWCNLETMRIHDQETLITLKMKSLDLEGLQPDQSFGIYENSEFADKTGAILNGIVLTMPEIKSASNGTHEISDEFGLKVYPNPFSDQCLIDFTLAREGKVKIALYNYTGEQMKQMDEAIYPKGSHQARLNSPNLTPGIYLLKIQITTDNQSCSGIMKLVVSK